MKRRVVLLAVCATLAGAAGASAAPRFYVQERNWIVSLSTLGGGPRLITPVKGDVDALSSGDGYLFWERPGGEYEDQNTLWRSGIDGSDPHIIVKSTSVLGGTAVVGNRVFWLDAKGISSAALDGSDVQRAAIRLPQDPPLGAASVELETDGHFLYYARCAAHAIGRVDPYGKDREPHFITAAKRRSCPDAFAVGGGYVFWFEGVGPDRIGRARIDGTHVDDDWLHVDTRGGVVVGMAADADYLFFAHAASFNRNHDMLIGRARTNGTGLLERFWEGDYNISLAMAA